MQASAFCKAFVLIISVFCQTLSGFELKNLNISNVEEQFLQFILKYGKAYRSGSVEYVKRLSVFKDNLERLWKLNYVPDSLSARQSATVARYGITKFSDLTPEEFHDKYLSHLKATSASVYSNTRYRNPYYLTLSTLPDIPTQFDWRDHGVITTPRDQKSCGGCWAFSSVETVESTYAITHKLPVVPLSVQQVIDCSFGYSILSGCLGGDTCAAFEWMKEFNVALLPETDYPLTDKTESCRTPSVKPASKVSVVNSTCQNFKNHESDLLYHIASHGPVTVSVDASDWANYQGGVIRYHCGEVDANHAVQIVGYNLDAPIPYYIVKNSWGTDFGHEGYLYIAYDSDTCRISEHVSQVWVS